MNTFLIFIPYLMELINNLSATLTLILSASLFLFFVWSVVTSTNGHPENILTFVKTQVWFPALIGTLVLLLIILPSKTTVYQMIGIWGGIEIAQSTSVKLIAPKTLEVLENIMDEYLTDTNKIKEIKE